VLRTGKLIVRIEAEGPGSAELLARAEAEGLELAGAGEEADLVARPVAARPIAARPTWARPAAERPGAASALSTAATRRPEGLGGRELEVLGYLAEGWSNAEIASILGIGIRTVRFHLERLYAKLGVSRRGEAVAEALRRGIFRLEV
jgi:DNA-binding CsgD family transcriptional regulator